MLTRKQLESRIRGLQQKSKYTKADLIEALETIHHIGTDPDYLNNIARMNMTTVASIVLSNAEV